MTITRRRLAGAALAVASFAALAAAGPASATVTCSYDNTNGLVSIGMDTTGDIASITLSGADIRVSGAACAGGPTVTNTTNILVEDVSTGGTTVNILDPAQFAPGAGGGEDGVAEIEFVLNLGAGSDQVELDAVAGAQRLHIGTAGANVNAVVGDGDPDLIPLGAIAERWNVEGSTQDDLITAQGGVGAGSPFTAGTVTIDGHGGNDTIEGANGALGSSGDSLTGSGGNDTVRAFGGGRDVIFPGVGNDDYNGGPGNEDGINYSLVQGGITIDLATPTQQPHPVIGTDSLAGLEEVRGTGSSDSLSGTGGSEVLLGGNGNDILNGRGGIDGLFGSDGSDTITYADAPAGVTVDLGANTAAGGAGNDSLFEVENVTGSGFADTLTGSALANSIVGLGGNDTISALAGPDTVDVRDGGPDTASCGADFDGATADQASVDSVNADCEVAAFLPEPDPAGDGGGGGGGDTELTFDLAGKAKQKILKQKGVVVSASCPLEDCTATATGKRLKPVTESVDAGAAEKLEVPIKRKKLRAIATALRAGKKPKVTVRASVTDAAGNVATDALTVRARR